MTISTKQIDNVIQDCYETTAHISTYATRNVSISFIYSYQFISTSTYRMCEALAFHYQGHGGNRLPGRL